MAATHKAAATINQIRVAAQIARQRARRRIEKFCGGLFLPTEIIKKENTVRSEGVFAKTSATNQTQAVRLRLCGKLFCFCGGYEVIFMDARV